MHLSLCREGPIVESHDGYLIWVSGKLKAAEKPGMMLFMEVARSDADNARYLNGEVLQLNLSTPMQPTSIFLVSPDDI